MASILSEFTKIRIGTQFQLFQVILMGMVDSSPDLNNKRKASLELDDSDRSATINEEIRRLEAARSKATSVSRSESLERQIMIAKNKSNLIVNGKKPDQSKITSKQFRKIQRVLINRVASMKRMQTTPKSESSAPEASQVASRLTNLDMHFQLFRYEKDSPTLPPELTSAISKNIIRQGAYAVTFTPEVVKECCYGFILEELPKLLKALISVNAILDSLSDILRIRMNIEPPQITCEADNDLRKAIMSEYETNISCCFVIIAKHIAPYVKEFSESFYANLGVNDSETHGTLDYTLDIIDRLVLIFTFTAILDKQLENQSVNSRPYLSRYNNQQMTNSINHLIKTQPQEYSGPETTRQIQKQLDTLQQFKLSRQELKKFYHLRDQLYEQYKIDDIVQVQRRYCGYVSKP